ncbi:MAG: redoxin family protein [Candidatus Heimdallarchaeaceae archaeon]
MFQRKNLLIFLILMLQLLSFPLYENSATDFQLLQNELKRPIITQQATDFLVKDVDSGITYTLSEFQGKVVILDLFATWCPPCKVSIPYLREVYAKYSQDVLQIISVDTDSSETQNAVSQFRKNESMDWIVSLDSEGFITIVYGTGSIPTFYIIDKQGNIQWSDSGFSNEETKPEMEHIIENLLQDKPANNKPNTSSNVFFIILEVSIGIIISIGVIYVFYKLKKKLGTKKCQTCKNNATAKCAKCGAYTCANCSSNGCVICGSRKFIRL